MTRSEPLNPKTVDVMAAAFRRRLRTTSPEDGPPMRKAWSPELRAYLAVVVAKTIATGHLNEDCPLTPYHAAMLARWICRVVTSSKSTGAKWTRQALDYARLPCRYCDNRSIRRVGAIGYCRKHQDECDRHLAAQDPDMLRAAQHTTRKALWAAAREPGMSSFSMRDRSKLHLHRAKAKRS